MSSGHVSSVGHLHMRVALTASSSQVPSFRPCTSSLNAYAHTRSAQSTSTSRNSSTPPVAQVSVCVCACACVRDACALFQRTVPPLTSHSRHYTRHYTLAEPSRARTADTIPPSAAANYYLRWEFGTEHLVRCLVFTKEYDHARDFQIVEILEDAFRTE